MGNNNQSGTDGGRMGRALRIGMVNHFMPEPGVKHGGVVQMAHVLAQGLAARGHEVTVWTYSPRPAGALYQVQSLPGERFARSWLGARLTFGLLGNLFFALPRYGDVDVLVVHGDSALLGLRRPSLIRIMYGSGLGEAVSASNPLRFGAQLVIYLQELFSALVQRNTLGISRNTTRHNPFVRQWAHIGVDTQLFRSDEAARSAHPCVLFVGTLGGRKRGGWLLEQFQKRILPRLPDAILHMVTEPGPESPGVVYHTGIADEDLAQLYRECWVYASPSQYEGFGLPYLEAMASRTPVLATPNPGSLEIIGDRDCGILARDEEFADRLLDLLTDPDLRVKCVAEGARRADELSLERMLDRYESMIEQVAGGD